MVASWCSYTNKNTLTSWWRTWWDTRTPACQSTEELTSTTETARWMTSRLATSSCLSVAYTCFIVFIIIIIVIVIIIIHTSANEVMFYLAFICLSVCLWKANSAFHPSGVSKWGPASAAKAKDGSFFADERRVCRLNCEIPWERVPYLSTLEVCAWRGAIQIHVYLYLTFSFVCLFACLSVCNFVKTAAWIFMNTLS